MKTTLTGTVRTWELNGTVRKWAEATLPFKDAAWVFTAAVYNAESGKGEQRATCDNHRKKLRRAMEEGKYTPTPFAAGLRKSHAEALKVETAEGGGCTFTLEVDSDSPLPLTDGGHRLGALSELCKDAQTRLGKSTDEADKRKCEARIREVEALPVSVTIQLDGDTKQDFVNLQSGRSVDAAHLFSLKVQQKAFKDPACELGVEVARLLSHRTQGPFKNLIRFDSRGNFGLPVSALCARGTSDLSTSLVGLARLAGEGLTAEGLAKCVMAAHSALGAKAPELLEDGKVLTSPASGTKGSATMLVGLGICLAQHTRQRGLAQPDAAALDALVGAAKSALNESTAGNLSGPSKRKLMGEFARAFFSGEGFEKHDGLPVSMLKALSPSAFHAPPLPKEAKWGRKAPVQAPAGEGSRA